MGQTVIPPKSPRKRWRIYSGTWRAFCDNIIVHSMFCVLLKRAGEAGPEGEVGQTGIPPTSPRGSPAWYSE